MNAAMMLILCFLAAPFFSHAIGPVAPTDDVFSKIKDLSDKPVNLPYKPVDPEDIEVFAVDSDNDTIKQPVETIAWDKIPYLPFKRAELAAAKDPTF